MRKGFYLSLQKIYIRFSTENNPTYGTEKKKKKIHDMNWWSKFFCSSCLPVNSAMKLGPVCLLIGICSTSCYTVFLIKESEIRKTYFGSMALWQAAE